MNTTLMTVITITMAQSITQSIHNITLIMMTTAWPMNKLTFHITLTWILWTFQQSPITTTTLLMDTTTTKIPNTQIGQWLMTIHM